MSYFCSKYLLAAKALAAKDWSHPKVLLAARHMAHDGATYREVKAALGWDCSDITAFRRLRKFNIRCKHEKRTDPKFGALPYLSPTMCRTGIVDQKNYKPREVRQ